MSRGLLIAFEGIDRSGKSTQANTLLSNNPNSTLFHAFPSKNTYIGTYIRDIITKKITSPSPYTLTLLNSADRHSYTNQFIHTLSTLKHDIILDRYSYSGIVYTMSVYPDIPYTQIITPEIGLIRPDITFYMDLHPINAKVREDYGNDLYETQQLQDKIYTNYTRFLYRNNWKKLDATKPKEILSKEIEDSINRSRKILSLKPIQYFTQNDF